VDRATVHPKFGIVNTMPSTFKGILSKFTCFASSIAGNLFGAEELIMTKDDTIIGRGSSGEVTVAIVKTPIGQRDVAVKRFKHTSITGGLSEKDARARFENEAQMNANYFSKEALAKAKHVCIPEFIDSFESNGVPHIVQEYIGGENLSDRINRERLKEGEVVRLLRDMLPTLQYIHYNKIVHRDICPDNIIQSKSGKYFLLDFGAATRIESRKIGTVVGHGVWSAPEQAYGDAKFQSDLYALGATAVSGYLGLSQHYTSVVEMIDALKHSQMDKNLVLFLEKMTQDRITDRYESATEARDILEEISGTVVIGSKLPIAPIAKENDDDAIVIKLRSTTKPLNPMMILSGFVLASFLGGFAISRMLISSQTPTATGGVPEVTPTESGGTAAVAPSGNGGSATASTTPSGNGGSATASTTPSGNGGKVAVAPTESAGKALPSKRQPVPKYGADGTKCPFFNRESIPGC
jgi:serine/threonine protein kinase